jgi:glycosyltransferase involved in cell wall biosynthesis
MPLPVEVEQPLVTPFVEQMIGGAFCVLSIFDFNSRIERKNPIGSIRAFRKAFPSENKDAKLILKTINKSSNNAQFDLIMREIGDDERIVVVDGILSRNELCALIASVDVFLSLHRSEGLGRPLVEAMLLGTPVVATQWSGPEDYLTTDTGYPIRSKLSPVLEGEYPHAAGEWADPDLEQAAQALRTIYTNKEDARSRSTVARSLVCEKYSTHSISQKLTSYFKSLDERRAGYRRKRDCLETKDKQI